MTVNPSRWHRVLVVIGVLSLALLACNAPLQGDAQITPTEGVFDFLTNTAQAALITPAYTITPDLGQPTQTLPPGVTPSATVCDYWMGFVTDVTIPDGTVMAPGQKFDKTWRIRNTGCLDWPTGTTMVFFGGEKMGGPENGAPVPELPVKNEGIVDVTVPLVAPSAPGNYEGYWQLSAPNRGPFGPQVSVVITVQSGPTPIPTIATPATGTPAYNPFIGTWINQKADTTNITKIEIHVIENVIFSHMWNKGVPADMDRGEVTTPGTDASDGVLFFSWVEDEYTETQQMSILLDGRLQVYGTVNYTDAARTDVTYTEYFHKQ